MLLILSAFPLPAVGQETGNPPVPSPPSPVAANPVQDPGSEAAAAGPEVPQQETPAVPAAESDVAPAAPQFYTLGSLSADGRDRYLVTFSPNGGTIHRIELNARDRKGNLAYRDLEHFGGFAGNLELSPARGGFRINCVGAGTPAADAGLKVGDLLLAFDGEPLTSAAEFRAMLSRKKIGDEVRLSIERKEDSQAAARSEITVRLTEQPLELVRPETGSVTPELRSPDSFVMTLLKPGKQFEDWPVIDPGMGTGAWEARETEIEGQPGIEFTREVAAELLVKAGLEGPLRVIKRYWLEPMSDSARQDFSSRSFHINFQIEIVSGAASEQPIAWSMDGPTGITTEGWWYQNKIHGRTSAFGYTAGARDTVSSTSLAPYTFLGAPEIISNMRKAAPDFQWLVEEPKQGEPPAAVHYIGVDSQYFNVSLLPAAGDEEPWQILYAIPVVASASLPKESKFNRAVDCTFVLFDRAVVSAGKPFRQTFGIFAGPKEKDLLETYGLESNRTFGWFAWLSKFLCWLLGVFYWMTGSFSYGLAIVLLTVLVRLLMIPISRKAALNAQMMQLLAPEMKAIAERYKDDMDKRAQAQRELFLRHRYNPFGGCFLVFLQLPVFIGLYRGLSVDIALRDKPLIPGMQWCSNLAAPDQMAYWKEWMPAWLGSETGWLGPWFNVLPLITIVLFLVQQKLFTPPPTDDNQKFAQRMMTWMMLFMGVMFFKVPSGLCIYFITSSLWGIAERQLLPKPKLSNEKLELIAAGTASSPAVPARRISSPSGPSEKPEAPARPGIASGLMKRLRDQIEYGESRPTEQKMDAETRKRLDRERKRKKRD